jgi:hypothetical protein
VDVVAEPGGAFVDVAGLAEPLRSSHVAGRVGNDAAQVVFAGDRRDVGLDPTLELGVGFGGGAAGAAARLDDQDG